MMKLMLDLGSGLGGASQAMVNHGWDIITVDVNPDFAPDIVADIREWSYMGPRPDLIWASPPCTEFAKFGMPCWYNPSELPTPNMDIVIACKRIIDEAKPRFWIIENVRGAVQFFEPLLGKPSAIFKPYYLWGYFPDLGQPRGWGTKTKKLSSSAKAERAKIPIQLSDAVRVAVERQLLLIDNYTAT